MPLNRHSITIDPAKLTGLRDWPHTLGNIKEVRKVLRVLGYQRPFIPNFAGFACPLMNLLKKDTPFEWTPNCCQALDTLIDIVTSSPVLIAPDQDRQFELEVDASQFAIRAILWQQDPANAKKLCTVGYYSATLSPAERNYKVFNRELLGIIRTLRHWSHLLRGTPEPVIIWTNHRNLTYWCEPQKVGPHAATWQVELQQYHYELRHKPGDTMKADALSRHPNFDTGNTLNEHLIVLPLDQFKDMPKSILDTLSIPSTLSLNVLGIEEEAFNANHLEAKVKLYQDDHYCEITPLIEPHHLRINSDNYLWKDSALVVVENNDLRRGILHHFHSSLTAGHPRIAKTIQLIQPFYWWPRMKDFVTNYVKGCATCQMNKINTHPT